jgi:voltage-gated potassium channel
MDKTIKQDIVAQRASLVRRLEANLDKPLAILGFVWLTLLVVEFTRGLSPLLTQIGLVIWAIFIADFLIKFGLAPNKGRYLRRHWLTAFALAIPAVRVVRVLRVFRAARAVRGLRLLRLLTSWNRGMRALGRSMRRRGFGYVIVLTLLVLVSGAAGMYSFERDLAPGRSLDDFGTALWWTAMLLTTMGSEYWPQTTEGRLLCLLLAIYGFTMFGYVTAMLATFFVARDAEDAERDAITARRAEAARLGEASERGTTG